VATVPTGVNVAAGQTSATFVVTTQSVTSASSVSVSASFVGQTTVTNLRVAPYVAPNLATNATITVSSENTSTQQQGIKAIDGIVDGSPGDYTKEWATNGQLAGAWINLAWPTPVTVTQVVLYDRPNLTDNVTSGTLSFSDGSTVNVGALPNDGSPLSVTIPARTVTSLKFTITSAVGQNIGLAEIAVLGSITTASSVNAVSISPSVVAGGNSAVGTVQLNGVAPAGGVTVSLASSNTSAATVPASVTVLGGTSSATFPINSIASLAPATVTITATYNGAQSATLTVTPVTVSSLTLSPATVVGGSANPTGTVALNGPAPAGGAVVALTSSNTAVATVPVNVTIPAGSTSTSFTVITDAVTTAVSIQITATLDGSQQSTLSVTPSVSGGGAMQQFATDNFNRPDGPLGSNWTTVMDSDNPPSIGNHLAESTYNRTRALYYGGISWTSDQYAEAQVVAQSNGSLGPAVRMNTAGNFYAGTVSSLGSGTANAYILLDVNESMAVIASAGGLTVLPNDYIQLSITGNVLTLTDVTNSTTLLTVSDSTLPAGYPGFYIGGTGSYLANWSAGVSTAPPALTTLATDNFNRANAPNLGPNWSVGPGYYAIQIMNEQIESAGQGQPPGQGHGKEYYTAVTFPSDQWSQAQVISSTNDVNGAIVRYQGTTDTHYVGFVSSTGVPGACSVSMDRDINSNPVVLATDSTYCSVAPGDYIRLQAQGNLLTLIDVTTNSLLLSVLDSQITGGSPGWSLNPSGGTPTAANWSGGGFSQ